MLAQLGVAMASPETDAWSRSQHRRQIMTHGLVEADTLLKAVEAPVLRSVLIPRGVFSEGEAVLESEGHHD